MKVKRFVFYSLIGILMAAFLAGCAGYMGYGKLRLTQERGDKMTVKQLKATWRDYDVYYAGYTEEHPSAVLFIPKKGPKTEVTDRWVKIEDAQTFSTVMSWLEFQNTTGLSYLPNLYQLLGPNNEFHGYMFTSWNHVYAKVVNDGSLRVYDLPLPPYLWINGPNFEREP